MRSELEGGAMRRVLLLATIGLLFASTAAIARYVHGQADAAPAGAGRSVRLEPGAIGIRILFGLRDTLPTQWSGSIAVTGGSLLNLEGWHFRQVDHFTGPASWAAFTRFGEVAARRRA